MKQKKNKSDRLTSSLQQLGELISPQADFVPASRKAAKQTAIRKSLPWLAGIFVLPLFIVASLPSCTSSAHYQENQVKKIKPEGLTVVPVVTKTNVQVVDAPKLKSEKVVTGKVERKPKPKIDLIETDRKAQRVLTLGRSGYAAALTSTVHDAKPEAKTQAKLTSAKPRRLYRIRSGDTLWHIAKSYYGNGALSSRIVAANQGMNPRHLKVGQQIFIP